MSGELKALISVHDVMPETMDKVQDILNRLQGLQGPPVPLLVVPGRDWNAAQLEQLRTWSGNGHPLIAHGWVHHVAQARGWYHRLHSSLISGDVAEHLAQDSAGVAALIIRSMRWFEKLDFPRPPYYVPPAWALGKFRPAEVPHDRRTFLPTSIEVLRGFLDVSSGKVWSVSMIGFEAVTPLKIAFVRQWNRIQLARCHRTDQPVRVGVHPRDFDLGLAHDLERLLSRPNLTPIAFDGYLNQ